MSARPGLAQASHLPPVTADSTEWMALAACAGHPDPDVFFPSSAGRGAQKQADEAKRVCRGCPVIVECDQFRRATGSVGVWGSAWVGERHIGAVPRPPAQHGSETRYRQHTSAGEKPCDVCRAGRRARRSAQALRGHSVGRFA